MKTIILSTALLFTAASWAITFDEAADIVTDDYMKGDLAGKRLYGLERVVEKGEVVYAWHDSVNAPADGYLFLLDPAPTANWEHECTWVFVAESTSVVSSYQMMTPPAGKAFDDMIDVYDSGYGEDVTYEEVRKAIRDRQREMFGADRYYVDRSQFKGARRVLLISGGHNASNNHIRYWGDIAFIYRALVNYYGYHPSEIEICMSDGDDPGVDQSNGQSSPLDLDGDNQPDYSKDATRTTVMGELQNLVDVTAPGDQVFVFTTDHGGGGSSSDDDVYLNLWNASQLEDDEFAGYMHNLPSDAIKVICMEQCFSGGFVDDIEDNNTSNVMISTAAGYWESSWAGDTYPYFDEYVYEYTAAVNWAYDDIYGSGDPVDADTDNNGYCEIDEAHIWAVDHDDAAESPQWYDSDNLGGVINLFGDISGVILTMGDVTHDDPTPGGNGNGIYEVGETVEVFATVLNIGQDTATGLQLTLTTDDPDLTIETGSTSLPDIPGGGNTTNSTPLTFSVSSSLDHNKFAELLVTVTGDGDATSSKTFTVPLCFDTSVIGFRDDIENGEGDWAEDGTGQWHLSDWTYNSPSHSWRCGNDGSSGYADNINASIYTPLVYIDPNKNGDEFTFWHKYGLETDYDYGYVDINGGSGWDNLDTFNGGTGSSWGEETYDISSYAGMLVQARFNMTTDVSIDSYGWDVDDVDLGYVESSGIEVYNFLAMFEKGEVNVQWSCTDNSVVGFNLYRREVSVPESALTGGVNASGADKREIGGNWGILNETIITGESPYRFVDQSVERDKVYEYKLEAVIADSSEYIDTTSVNTAESNIPFTYRLGQSYPNPAAGIANIDFALPRAEKVTLKLYDMKGRCIATPIESELPVGIHSIPVDVSALADGVYLYRVETPNYNETMKMIVGR